MKDKIVKTCLNIDCPERFSLCCHAGSRSASEPEILLGVPAYFCAKCGKEFEGGKCTAGEPIHHLDNKVKPEGVGEWVERIVIEYANLSGRESANRAEFRKRVEVIVSNLILQEKAKWKREILHLAIMEGEDTVDYKVKVLKLLES
jgi:hypothetical protein